MAGKSADPAAMPEPEFSAKRRPPELGDSRTDPPMVVRTHPDDDPRDPRARRVIRTDVNESLYPWALVTGTWPTGWLWSADVADWPITHPVFYTTAFRHASRRPTVTAGALDGSDAEGAAPFKDAR